MGLVLVCPQCQANVLLQSLNCPYCQADLRQVPQDQRRYVLGQPGPAPAPPEAPPAASAPAEIPPAAAPEAEPVPPAATAMSEVRIRRPHVRRYAATPVSVTHPVSGKKAATSAAGSKSEPKKTKKASSGKKKK
jgi:hypothetical protein